MVQRHLQGKARVTEISLRNGTVVTAGAAAMKRASISAKKGTVSDGGVMVEKFIPLSDKGDVIVLVCPNL